MFKYGFILMVICVVAALCLSFVYEKTKPLIAAQLNSEEKDAIYDVLPGIDSYENRLLDSDSSATIKYFEGKKFGEFAGYILPMTAKGYSGDIEMLVGFTNEGVIKGVTILSQHETPGLGSKIIQINPGEEKPWFLEKFVGKNASDLQMKDIQAITGATISSKAVLDAIRREVDKFLKIAKDDR